MSILNFDLTVNSERQPELFKNLIDTLKENGHDVRIRKYEDCIVGYPVTGRKEPHYDFVDLYNSYYASSNHQELGVKIKFGVVCYDGGVVKYKCHSDHYDLEINSQEQYAKCLERAYVVAETYLRSEFGLFRKHQNRFQIKSQSDIQALLGLKGHPKKVKLSLADLPAPLKFSTDKFAVKSIGKYELCEYNRNIRACAVKGVAVIGKNLSVSLDATQVNSDPWFFVEVWGLRDSSEHMIVKPHDDELIFFPTRGSKHLFVSDNFSPKNKQLDFTEFSVADAEVVEFAITRYVQQICGG